MENSANAILAVAHNLFEALVFLSIGTRESYLGAFGAKDANNPMQLSKDAGLGNPKTKSLSDNVRGAAQTFRDKFSNSKGNLYNALVNYNGAAGIKEQYGKDVLAGYTDLSNSLESSTNLGESWPW